MKITVNGAATEIRAGTLAGALEELGYGEDRIATAVNGTFVPAATRAGCELSPGDQLEILAPRQGG